MAAYALIAEPDAGLAQLYRQAALAAGLDVELARDGDEALAALSRHGPPALLITELSLPRKDGFAVLDGLRRVADEGQSPAIVVSAFRVLREAAALKREELGISALLAKTSSVESIRRAIKKVLSSSTAPHKPAQAAPLPVARAEDRSPADEDREEELRLQHLDESELVDEGPPEEELTRIVQETAAKFGVPVALITLVLEDRQWFKAHVGLEGPLLEQRGSPRDWSFCSHVVQGRSPLVVPDALVHPSFAENPLVRDGSLRSYAGAPLETAGGDILGTLCIMDKKPMAITAADVDQLVLLARMVAGELELRAHRKRLAASHARLAPVVQDEGSPGKSYVTALTYLSAVLENIDNGVFLLDGTRRLVFANRALAELWGTSVDALLGRERDDVLREVSQQFASPGEFLDKLRTAPSGPFALRGEFELERPHRRIVRWVAKPVQLGSVVGHLGVVTDITAERDLLREREQLARTDPITGLSNRRGGEDVLDREASRAQRFGSRVSVALFDIDLFKQVNDRHGHAAGDETLRAVAQVLSNAVRGADVAARWGGDELLAVLPSTGLEGARSFGERVRAQVEALDPGLGHGVTLSCGIAELQPGEDPAEAVRRADVSLYAAKDAGRNRVR